MLKLLAIPDARTPAKWNRSLGFDSQPRRATSTSSGSLPLNPKAATITTSRFASLGISNVLSRSSGQHLHTSPSYASSAGAYWLTWRTIAWRFWSFKSNGSPSRSHPSSLLLDLTVIIHHVSPNHGGPSRGQSGLPDRHHRLLEDTHW